ncbi:MAG: AbrB/MazE/SpoVT family DNA-binding domain-containing protein [Hydrogenobacter thermophilus]|uniref:AbrB/MazE/SpoVT family DNA-binding domain-containing protein n=1 Tax=Hydrogenobacter thermophilus TaxID=940 RepID=UPI001C789D7D|nr:AbrB/MazE/SpoVT family DNA-binding domain-containing protein [Hydrogenobacter thermophilus]QWK19119.1 MAG: AbrB/MazE/SpoVT family DNA-binding domain-containing protein [Hydrogenobacter thermophilus]
MAGIVKLSSKGQIVIPKELRDKLGLKAGDYLLIDLKDNEVKLRKIKPIEKFRGILKESLGDSELEERFEEAMAKGEV